MLIYVDARDEYRRISKAAIQTFTAMTPYAVFPSDGRFGHLYGTHHPKRPYSSFSTGTPSHMGDQRSCSWYFLHLSSLSRHGAASFPFLFNLPTNSLKNPSSQLSCAHLNVSKILEAKLRTRYRTVEENSSKSYLQDVPEPARPSSSFTNHELLLRPTVEQRHLTKRTNQPPTPSTRPYLPRLPTAISYHQASGRYWSRPPSTQSHPRCCS